MSDLQQHIWLITGANRGIGLEMTKQLLESSSDIVVAACRDLSKTQALDSLSAGAPGRLHIVSMDTSNFESIRNSVAQVTNVIGEKGIDYLINNAGITSTDTAFDMEMDVLQKLFTTNVMGPAYISQRFLPLVEKSEKKTIINITSTLGSKGATFGPQYGSYCISKSGLCMLSLKQAKERTDITTVCICPGWLKTDLGTQYAEYEVSFGVEGVLKVIHSLTLVDSGKFYNHKGEIVPW